MLNRIELAGILAKGPTYSYQLGARKFYKGEIIVTRLSGIRDRLPFVCQEDVAGAFAAGDHVVIKGNIRTRDYVCDDACHLDVFIYARSIELAPGGEEYNEVLLEGAVCHATEMRQVGSRQIAVIKLANNETNKTNYIPCVLWGRLAAQDWICGDFVSLSGRLQSREYIAADGEIRATYEVSVVNAAVN